MEKQLIENNKNYRSLKILFLSIGLMSLSGCAVHKASFDCPNGKGMGCGSMTDVHKAIKDNSFKAQVESQGYTKPEKACVSCQKSNSKETANISTVIGNNQSIYSIKNKVSRSQDKIMRIWFNSYFDEYNNFHDAQYIYTIIEPAQWIVNGPNKL
jgi:type IV conjugative transfer system lipoprotein TraV